MPDDELLNVFKPGRYIGQEWNASSKDFHAATVTFALCFPDLYEVGMSNTGIRIIYGLLNNLPDVSCERFFAPAQDREAQLRSNKRRLSSLESGQELARFDLVGFSLGFELCYTNVLNMLELGGVLLDAHTRDYTFPLVIGGGPCVLNPEPMHRFFDLFVIGEAEEVLVEIVDLYRKHREAFKTGRLSKEELLVKLASIEGVYVPSLYTVAYDRAGGIFEFTPRISGVPVTIKKRFVANLNTSFYPFRWVVPFIEVIHDRITLEIMRGCPNRCRFCQARYQYYPLRQRDAATVTRLACSTYASSGYDEISLGGLSVSDYPDIENLVGCLIGLFKEKGVSVSLPSIQPKALLTGLSALIASIKKTGLTFAPEAATEQLRQVLDKKFDTEAFFKAMEAAYAAGYQRVKLYFMIGLPGETERDLDGIIDFAQNVSELRKKAGARPAQVNVSVNTLIPKPHTPLQWFPMVDRPRIRFLQEHLKGKLRNRRLKFAFHNGEMSFLEAVLSRGDRRLSEVILAAFKLGCRFDAWENYFVFERWLQAFQGVGIQPDGYLVARTTQERLPWDFLDLGVDKKILIAEYNDAVSKTAQSV